MFVCFNVPAKTNQSRGIFRKRLKVNCGREDLLCRPWRSTREMWETRRRILLKILLRLDAEREHQTAHFETANYHAL